MKAFLKRNWFVAVVACIFLAFTIFFIYDQNKDVLRGKKANGAGVVYSLDGVDVTADDLYSKYYISGGKDAAYMLVQRMLLDAEVKTTDDMEKDAAEMADRYEASYEQYYGSYASSIIENSLRSIGLDSLEEYCLYSEKQEQVDRQYILNNEDKYWQPYADEKSPRLVAHVLIQMDDPDNPTEDEQKKLDEAKEAWASGKYTFAEFAQQYSDDATSAARDGVVGVVDTDSYSTYVEPFVDTALSLKEGEVSDWVKSDYGYHLITVTSTKAEDCLQESSCVETVINYYDNLEEAAIWDLYTRKNVQFTDDNIAQALRETLKVNDDNTVTVTKASKSTETEDE